MTYYHTPLRSSLPQQRWREEADRQERKRAAAEAASRRRAQQTQTQTREREQSSAAAAERSARDQFATLRNEFAQQQETLREAMVQYVVSEFEELRKELRIDAERQLKRRLVELEREFEHKFAALRPLTIRGTYVEDKHFLQHDVVAKNGGSYVARKDAPGICPGVDWQQISQPGKTGPKGERGFAGARGPQGESGATFLCWKIDKKNFVAIPLMTNGREGPRLHLRELFEEYHSQACERE